MADEFYTVEELADRLKLSAQTIRMWIREGKVEAYQFGRAHRIRREEVERLITASKRPKALAGMLTQIIPA